MGADPDVKRVLVMHVGAEPGSVIPVPPAVSIVGNDEIADIRLPFDGVSRRHFRLDGSGSAVVVTDSGTANGTWVNGRRIDGPVALRDGDVMHVGPVRLQFFDDATPAHGRLEPAPGAVHVPSPSAGPVFTAQQDQYVAGGNQTWNQVFHVQRGDDPSDELFQGRGPGRTIAVIGMLTALGGFGWFAYSIFTMASSGGPTGPGFPPQSGYAFGIFVLGGVIAGIGVGMSRARRRRGGG